MGGFASRYLATANFQSLVISTLYIDRHHVLGGGKDNIYAPSVTFVGEFEKIVMDGEPVEVDLFIADLDTPEHLVSVDAFSSNPELIAPDPNIGGDRCSSICMQIVTPKQRKMVLTPRAGQYGAARITVTASDDSRTTKTSFIVYVPPHDCAAGDRGRNATEAAVHHDGCAYRTRIYDPIPENCAPVELAPGTAGEPYSFQIRSADQFGHPVHDQDIEIQFNSSLAVGDTLLTTSVEYSGDGGIYNAGTDAPISISGSFFLRIEATFVIRTVHTRYDGLQIPGSPFEIVIRPGSMDFASCVISGLGISVSVRCFREGKCKILETRVE